jgi:hypothetical protein
MMEFWLSGSLSHEPFSLFLRWNSGYHQAFHMNLFFLTVEFWLSGSPFHEFFFHNGISAITEPLYEFLFHTMESRLSRSLFTNFLSHDGISAITKPLYKFFFHTMESRLSRSLSHDGIHKMHDLGEDSFHIYHKEYLHRIRLIKNLAS